MDQATAERRVLEILEQDRVRLNRAGTFRVRWYQIPGEDAQDMEIVPVTPDGRELAKQIRIPASVVEVLQLGAILSGDLRRLLSDLVRTLPEKKDQ